MGVERYVIEAVLRDGRSHREAARSAGVSKAWVTKLWPRMARSSANSPSTPPGITSPSSPPESGTITCDRRAP